MLRVGRQLLGPAGHIWREEKVCEASVGRVLFRPEDEDGSSGVQSLTVFVGARSSVFGGLQRVWTARYLGRRSQQHQWQDRELGDCPEGVCDPAGLRTWRHSVYCVRRLPFIGAQRSHEWWNTCLLFIQLGLGSEWAAWPLSDQKPV